MEAAGRMKNEGAEADLLERIADDDAFGMTMADLREIADPSRFVGRAPEQVDRFLAEWVQPALERLETGANERLGEPDVRV
jgi:adenylosuccinate lyase